MSDAQRLAGYRFAVVVPTHHHVHVAQRHFRSARILTPQQPLVGYRFDELLMLWMPDTEEDIRWYDQLRSKLVDGGRIGFLAGYERSGLEDLTTTDADIAIIQTALLRADTALAGSLIHAGMNRLLNSAGKALDRLAQRIADGE